MKLRLLVLGCVLFSFTSCLDIIETFNLKEDGSGVYEVKTDMSNAMAMLSMMGGGQKDSDKMPEKMDTSFSFKSMVDTVTSLTAEEKAAISKITASLHMNKEKGEMYMVMNMPFKDSKEYNLIQAAFQKIDEKDKSPMDGLFKGLFGGAGDNPMASGDEQVSKGGGNPTMPGSNFETSITPNSIIRKVKDMPKPAIADKTDDMPAELKEMFKMTYTTIVNLPRPVKKLTGAGKLSDDKKQVKTTRKIDLASGFSAADFDFTIDF